jgi:hypothetical protein
MTSPFYIVSDFLSAKLCEDLIDKFQVKTPNTDQDGKPIKLERIINSTDGQDIILNKLYQHIGMIEEKYNCSYKGTEQLVMTHFPENDKNHAQAPGCENARFFRKKWIKCKDVDLTGYIWLKEFNDKPPLDPSFEVYGGKIEFPGYNFSLAPQRGTLVLYPAGPHFANSISPVVIGDMYQIKINMSISNKNGEMWVYDPSEFQVGPEGFLVSWFHDFL